MPNVGSSFKRDEPLLMGCSTALRMPPSSFRAFDEFIRDRAARLLILIEVATGKSVTGKDSEEVVGAWGGLLKPIVASEA
jgi:hypothetical protein